MKVALVTNSFPAMSETFIYNHAAGLRSAGVDVTVVAAGRSRDTAYYAGRDGLVYDGPIRYALLGADPTKVAIDVASSIVRRRDHALWKAAQQRYGVSKRALRAVLLALPLRGFDLVHFEYSGLALAASDALPLLAPARLIVSCRGAAEQVTPLVEPGRVGRLRELFATVDRVHCVSDDMLATCTRYGLDPAKAFVNRPAIDLARFRRTMPYVARTSGPFRLLSTGRLHWKKGLEFGLLAVRALLDAGLDVHYEILGGGPEEERLRFTVHDLRMTEHVTFSGRKSSAEVQAALERCDVYLLPSLSEGISNAALEAMSMELPVVATSAGGMTEAITHGVDGMIVPPRSPAAMAEAIASVLRDRELRTNLGRAARRRIESAFSLDRQISVFVAAYQSVLDAAVPA